MRCRRDVVCSVQSTTAKKKCKQKEVHETPYECIHQRQPELKDGESYDSLTLFRCCSTWPSPPPSSFLTHSSMRICHDEVEAFQRPSSSSS